MIVSVVVAWGYTTINKRVRRKQQREKVQINNPNVKLFQNITYNNHLPGSQLDIMMPDDVDKDTKLPVIFWMHGGVMLQVINNIKIHCYRKLWNKAM